jgi:hypothetical protein
VSIARADLTITAWDRTTRCQPASSLPHDGVEAIVDDLAAGSHSFREVVFAVTVGEVIATIPCVWGEVRPHQQLFVEATK